MTVTELIRNFREGLVGLLPAVKHVRMPWHSPNAYDEWDELVQAVYEALVVWPLRWTLPESEHECFDMPKYNLLLPSYTGKSVIEILPAQDKGTMKVFHALGTSLTPFDIIEWRDVSLTGTPKSSALNTTPIEEARLALRFPSNGFPGRTIEEVTIPAENNKTEVNT